MCSGVLWPHPAAQSSSSEEVELLCQLQILFDEQTLELLVTHLLRQEPVSPAACIRTDAVAMVTPGVLTFHAPKTEKRSRTPGLCFSLDARVHFLIGHMTRFSPDLWLNRINTEPSSVESI